MGIKESKRASITYCSLSEYEEIAIHLAWLKIYKAFFLI
jgi:hypothetical protein